MGIGIYVVSMPGVGCRIGIQGGETRDVRRLAQSMRKEVLKLAFLGREVLLVDFSGLALEPYWIDQCRGEPFRRSSNLMGRRFWATYASEVGRTCLEEVASDDNFETGELGVISLSRHESSRELEEEVFKSLRRGPWPVASPRAVETMHLVDDGMVIWWGHPNCFDSVHRMLERIAAANDVNLSVVVTTSHNKLVDRFFVGA